MSLHVEVSHSVGKEWNEKLLENEYSTTYQTKEWCELYESSFASIPVFISVYSADGKIVGQLSSLIHKDYFWRDSNFSGLIGKKLDLGSYLHWISGPIIHDISKQKEILSNIFNSLDSVARKYNVSMIRGSLLPSLSFSNDLLIKLNYSPQEWSTYVINLNKSEQQMYDSLDKSTRYDIRKTKNSNFEFEIVNKKSSWMEYIEMKLDARKRVKDNVQKKPLFYEKHWETLQRTGKAKLFLAKCNHEPVSGILCFTFNKNIVQYGVVTSGSSSLAGSFLTWNIIKWAIDEKFPYYDMGGVNPHPTSKKEKNIDFFKSKWGGQKVTYPVYTKMLNKRKMQISKILKNPNIIERKLKNIFHMN